MYFINIPLVYFNINIEIYMYISFQMHSAIINY